MNAISLPILYSFRRCPYAIRARLAIAFAQQQVVVREVVLKDKPPEMLALSPKGTVPVLHLPDGQVIDESRDIMLWALHRNDPLDLLCNTAMAANTDELIAQNDGEFKHWLDRYKYADRYPENSAAHYRTNAEVFLKKLERCLLNKPYLCAEKFRFADIAIMPFIRQFAMVDKCWFDAAPYPAVQKWLETWLNNEVFKQMMHKHAPWQEGQQTLLLDHGVKSKGSE